MKEHTYKQFAAAFLALTTDFPLYEAEIAWLVEHQGLDSFLLIAGDHDPGLAEAARLLINMNKGGA